VLQRPSDHVANLELEIGQLRTLMQGNWELREIVEALPAGRDKLISARLFAVMQSIECHVDS
jgi:hypothetical protein